MKLSDLKKVYRGKILVTINGYFSDGEYFSFRTLSSDGRPVSIDDIKEEHLLDMEVLAISTSADNGSSYLMVDIKEIIPHNLKRKMYEQFL